MTTHLFDNVKYSLTEIRGTAMYVDHLTRNAIELCKSYIFQLMGNVNNEPDPARLRVNRDRRFLYLTKEFLSVNTY